jgi:mono/diheme cytochrome c family protein
MSALDPRAERDQAAKAELLHLNLFHGGYGMHISPSLIAFAGVAEKLTRATGIDNPLLKNRYGLTQVNGKIVGLFNIDYEGIQVGVLGCVACHSGKAAGQFIIGIGNKNIDVAEIGKDAFRVEQAWKVATPDRRKSEAYRRVESSAIAFADELRDPKRENLTQGLVPTSVIRKWFYRMAGEDYPEDMPRGAVKIPHLFGYGEKRKVGQFSDGGGNGMLPGWGSAVELAAGQLPENVREYLPRLSHVEDIFGDLLPPKYPFPIDRDRATRGSALFARNCVRCHGNYSTDADGHPIYVAPKVVPWSVVRTDHDRLDRLDDHFLGLIEKSPLADVIQQTKHRDSYIAPRLHAVWARFPYLHNGSVPTVRDLLGPAAKRPKLFSLRNAGERERFDPVNLGLQVRGKFAITRPLPLGRRATYDTRLPGQSNTGHEFAQGLTDAERTDVIEYLKTL